MGRTAKLAMTPNTHLLLSSLKNTHRGELSKECV
jgi:hypothetical protein